MSRLTPRTAALIVAASILTLTANAASPPVAEVKPVVDDYFGTPITDNYRWMEDRTAPAFVAWAKAENAYSRAVIDAIPGRDALQARVAKHTAGGVSLKSLKMAGGKVFYLKRVPGENAYRLYVRKGAGGPERVLVDPDTIPTEGAHFAIDYFEPSLDGKRLAYGISPGGSENSVIHILDVDTGKQSPETIDRAEYGNPDWLPGGKAFFYNRFVKLGPNATETDKYLNSRALLHVVGTDPETDVPLIGTGIAGSPQVTPVDQAFISAVSGFAGVFGIIVHGADPDVTIYQASTASILAGHPLWSKVADVEDQVANITAHGTKLYLLSHKNAPHYQVLEVDAAMPDLASAKAVVPASARIVQDFRRSSDALYIRELDGGLGRVQRLDFASGKLTDLTLPIKGSVQGPVTDQGSPDLLLGLQNWVTAPAIYRTHSGKLMLTDIVPKWSDDLSPYTSEEVMVTARDGVQVPLSIVYRKGLKRDGKHALWLTGYGAYGNAYTPNLLTGALTLLDDGGVYAVAHVRGGGEFGEDWHLAGKLATKPNTYRDLIACAEYLVAQGYGKPETLAIEGRSAGGITVGMAMTERPDLFRVVFSSVGDNNTLRSENGTDGPANSLEYGSVATEAGFKALYAVDSTQHVKPGVAYPAVLLTTGMNDPRVAPWQPGKMAAHLQAASSSGRPVLMLVDFDAGHGVGSTKAQRDRELADQLAFFYWQIGKAGYQP